METQSYANHRRFVPLFHGVLFLLIVLTLIGSLVNLYFAHTNYQHFHNAALIFLVTVCLLFLFFFCRNFPLKVQDRAIRAEENLRHFVLTGKTLDPRLTISQIIGLRFASDEEFAALAKKAADENLSGDQIKRSVKNWRPDHHRA
jgi:small-conductance mechanosensitive channel